MDKEISLAMELGKGKCDGIEVLISQSSSNTLKMFNGEIENVAFSDNRGFGIRVIRGQKVGYSYTEAINSAEVTRAVNEALANCEVSEATEVVELASEPVTMVDEQLLNPELSSLSSAAMIELLKETETIAKAADNRIENIPHLTTGVGQRSCRIINSAGLDCQEASNNCYAYMSVLAAGKAMKSSGSGFALERDFSKISANDVANQAVLEATCKLDPISFNSGQYPVVFRNSAVVSLLGSFSGIFNAKAVERKLSPLAGRLGEILAVDGLSIIDDGRLRGGFATSSFDSEGIATKRTELISDGTLASFLHNSITAHKAGVESTGNATRGYSSALGIGPTNLMIASGVADYNKFCREDSIEIISLQGLHSGCNPVSGDFSLSAEGILWKDGKSQALPIFTVSGNFIDLLANITDIGSDQYVGMSAISAPSIRINQLPLAF